MNRLSQSEIQELATQNNSPCISIYLPTEKAGAETRKNSIKFKNLLSEAETKIAQMQFYTDMADSLKEAKSYLENYDFWQNQDLGLAFFIDSKGVKYYQLASSFEEKNVVSDRFYLRPLLNFASNDSQFYLLAIAQNKVQLFLGDLSSIKEIDLPDSVPVSSAEALKYDDPKKQTQYHSGDAGGSPIYHGQGVGTTDNKDEIKRFLQQVDNNLQSAFNAQSVPLILAGVEYLLPIYQEINSYSNLIPTGITGNPEHVSTEDLHSSAWKIMADQLATKTQAAIERYANLSNSEETTDRIEEIVAAAVNGQIDTLFVADNISLQWGNFDPQNNRVEIQAEAGDRNVDLYDLAVVNTYIQGGQVYQIEPDRMSDNKPMMAILRYRVYAETKKVTV